MSSSGDFSTTDDHISGIQLVSESEEVSSSKQPAAAEGLKFAYEVPAGGDEANGSADDATSGETKKKDLAELMAQLKKM